MLVNRLTTIKMLQSDEYTCFFLSHLLTANKEEIIVIVITRCNNFLQLIGTFCESSFVSTINKDEKK